ncbi:uncharacterized [Tachysurus ichikawai]
MIGPFLTVIKHGTAGQTEKAGQKHDTVGAVRALEDSGFMAQISGLNKRPSLGLSPIKRKASPVARVLPWKIFNVEKLVTANTVLRQRC